jgi:hypothetical protein
MTVWTSIYLVQKSYVSTFQHSNETSDSIKVGEIIDEARS